MAIELGDGVIRITGDTAGLQAGLKKVGAIATVAGVAITAALTDAVSKAAEFTKGLGELNTLGIKDLKSLE